MWSIRKFDGCGAEESKSDPALAESRIIVTSSTMSRWGLI